MNRLLLTVIIIGLFIALSNIVYAQQIFEIPQNENNNEYVTTVQFSPDSTQLIAYGHHIRFWNLETGDEMMLDKRTIYSVAISPDKKWILTGSVFYLAQLWEYETGKLIYSVEHPIPPDYTYDPGGIISGVDFFSDGKRFITGDWDGYIKTWDIETGDELNSIYNLGARGGLKLLPNNNMAYVSRRVVDIETGKTLHGFRGDDPVLSPDRMYVYTWKYDTNDSKYKLSKWASETGELLEETVINQPKGDGVLDVKISPNGNLYMVTDEFVYKKPPTLNNTEIIGVENKNVLQRIEFAENDGILDAAYSPDMTKLAVLVQHVDNNTHSVYVYDIRNLTAGVKRAEEY